jgi:hypothetical protein
MNWSPRLTLSGQLVAPSGIDHGSITVVGDLPRALILGHPTPGPMMEIARSTYYAEAAAKAAE